MLDLQLRGEFKGERLKGNAYTPAGSRVARPLWLRKRELTTNHV